MAVIHISEAEAVQGFADVLARVRAGEDVRIEGDGAAVVLRTEAHAPKKSLPEAIRLAKARALTATLDEQFARDLDRVIRNHEHQAGMRNPWEE